MQEQETLIHLGTGAYGCAYTKQIACGEGDFKVGKIALKEHIELEKYVVDEIQKNYPNLAINYSDVSDPLCDMNKSIVPQLLTMCRMDNTFDLGLYGQIKYKHIGIDLHDCVKNGKHFKCFDDLIPHFYSLAQSIETFNKMFIHLDIKPEKSFICSGN